jgi:hypothetical protein
MNVSNDSRHVAVNIKSQHLSFEVFIVKMSPAVFWVLTPCGLVGRHNQDHHPQIMGVYPLVHIDTASQTVLKRLSSVFM